MHLHTGLRTILASVLLTSGAYAGPPNVATLIPTFSDEFNSPTLDRNKWDPHYNNAAIYNNELQAYLPGNVQPDPANGVMRFVADKQSFAGQAYTSGVISSYQHFQQTYGYFEVRARLPKGQGYWPAFWLYAAAKKDEPNEIDIMENLGKDMKAWYATTHFMGSNGYPTANSWAIWAPTDMSQGYHTWAVEWQPGLVVWYYDGIEKRRVTGSAAPSVPMQFIVNLALGGSWSGAPDATTPFPASLDVDYVRAYQFPNLVGAVAPIDLGYANTTITPAVAKTGDVVTINTNLKSGAKSMGSVTSQLTVNGFFGQPWKANIGTQTVTLPANASIPLTYSYKVPSTLTDGVYSIYATVTPSGGTTLYLLLGRVVIQNGSVSPLPKAPIAAAALPTSSGGTTTTTSSSGGTTTTSSSGGTTTTSSSGGTTTTSSSGGTTTTSSSGGTTTTSSSGGTTTTGYVVDTAYPVVKVNLKTANFTGYPGRVKGNIWSPIDGSLVQLIGSGWGLGQLTYKVTPKTVMEFDVITGGTSQFVGMGLLDAGTYTTDAQLSPRIFQLDGTGTAFGIPNYRNLKAATWYSKHLVIPVGAHYSGDIQKMVITRTGSTTGYVHIKNLKLYESK